MGSSYVATKLAEAKEAMLPHSLQSASISTDKQAQLDHFRVTPNTADRLTTNWGQRISNTDTSLRAGARGPELIEDFHLREKITHFDHERIPERVVHARGSGAYGYFQLYNSQEEVTCAAFLNDTSRRTPVFVRFSTVLGSRGSADTVRDVRGFATRFYTAEGNFDLVGNNIPVFFIQDGIKFPDIIHAGKPEPHNEIPQAQSAHDNFWDFISLQPETAHMVAWILSDRAIPRSYRMMQGFGVNTYTLVNSAGQRCFVKFHWRPLLGVHSLAWDEAQKLAGQDPDFHRRDLWESIELGTFPEYELGLQIISEADEHKFEFDILDCTKIIPEELVPVRYIGRMTLNKNPSEFFPETEQVAFCTQHVVQGIGFSDDPVLQARNLSYLDTQINRFGTPNFMEIPINRPLCPVLNHQQDGAMRQRITVSKVNYHPNRFDQVPPAAPSEGAYLEYPEKVEGLKQRLRGPKFREHFRQATLFYNSLSVPEKLHFIKAARFEIGRCAEAEVRRRAVHNILVNIDFEMARQVAEGVGVPAPAAPPTPNHRMSSPLLSQLHVDNRASPATRKIAILLADGFDFPLVSEMRNALRLSGAVTYVVAPRLGPIVPFFENGPAPSSQYYEADFTIFTCKSTLFDAVILPGGRSAVTLMQHGESIQFIHEAFVHCKPVGILGESVELIRRRSLLPRLRFSSEEPQEPTVVSDQGVITAASLRTSTAAQTAGGAGAGLGFLAGAVAGGPIGAAIGATAGALGGAAAGHAAGALAGSPLSDFISAFTDALSLHRFWMRDVSTVPA